ncbi:MAG: DUF2442 domain-containing protein [Spirosomaceae bacterium]|nr:DUF2442 domain-containing protein [Spirosomataceae bacterium]
MIPKPVRVQSVGKYKIELHYEDGTQGVADLSHLAHKGVFVIWEAPDVFDDVYIDSETGAIAWTEDIDVCPDALFFKIKQTTFDQWKENQLEYAYH